MIYFAQCVSGGPIKIGNTRQLKQRLKSLEVSQSSKMRILGVMDGDRNKESLLHQHFRGHSLGGEWFAPAQEIMSYIASECHDWDGNNENKNGRNVTESYVTSGEVLSALEKRAEELDRSKAWVVDAALRYFLDLPPRMEESRQGKRPTQRRPT